MITQNWAAEIFTIYTFLLLDCIHDQTFIYAYLNLIICVNCTTPHWKILLYMCSLWIISLSILFIPFFYFEWSGVVYECQHDHTSFRFILSKSQFIFKHEGQWPKDEINCFFRQQVMFLSDIRKDSSILILKETTKTWYSLPMYICNWFNHISVSLLDVVQIENQYFLDLFISCGLGIPSAVHESK